MTERETDKGLVEAAAGGSVEAFTLLVWRWRRPLYNFLLRLTGDREQARDISQEAFLRAYTRLKDLREKEKFASWLFSIAVRLHWSHLRTQPATCGNCQPEEADSNAQTAEQASEARARQLTVRELISRLPAGQREVVLLKVYHGFRFEEIASILDCPVSTVKSRLYKAFDLIRAGWEGQNPPADS